MHVGVVGLGRMGRIVVDRLLDAGHEVTAFDIDSEAREKAAAAGAETVAELTALPDALPDEERIWMVLPHGEVVDETLDELDGHLSEDAIVVDGGNCNFKETLRRGESIDATLLDCGTSGGPAGAELGFSMMIGGPEWAYEELEPAFDAVATNPEGHARMGPLGSGHYVKMIHNGVEYALMQAYGEGFELLANGRYDLDMEQIAHTWNNGAVIRSWLLELAEESFAEEGNDLGTVADRVEGGSTGTWTVQEALEQEVSVPLIYQALAERFDSRATGGERGKFSRRVANRLRYGFGRHPVPRTDE
ncbi:NADP-dependent phosphogluconate dehydrogenase [Halococcoides cellulosivorans]|uniref:6-phosphogluconate dehydrogenase, NAD(+)-dependent, decarboxylating n=1 Tax=Halococcoides cellulosivorans TaxID=1679096 RepID=A0A2R4WZR8_9EURY|nr:NADP-dependent phosphogluconate dehydrogenase [Halococcoides cellulosivorans]AWB27042.1 6-phosphogluconate dehydrogenase [Halococcoides cellulosivorans]